jgi:hypothetical protein
LRKLQTPPLARLRDRNQPAGFWHTARPMTSAFNETRAWDRSIRSAHGCTEFPTGTEFGPPLHLAHYFAKPWPRL